jgi:putative ABC transport system permease protein
MLLKRPGFTFVAVLTLALGIGANSAIFSVVNAVLLRPLPYKDSEQIVDVYESLPQGGKGSVSVPNLKDWREQNEVFEAIAAYDWASFNLQAQEQPERIVGVSVSAEFFDVLGVAPQLGRTFQKGEDTAGNERVVVIADALWRKNFGGDPSIVGKNIQVGGVDHTVVGVMPPQFKFQTAQMWLPLVFGERQLANRGSHAYSTVARLKPGVTVAQAQAEMSAIARRLEQAYPDTQQGRGVALIPVQEDQVGYMRPALFVLLGAVGFVLLIACTNVANLLLARAASRRREIAIRTALGAGRGRLIRQFLTESVLLSVLGGLFGMLIAKWGTDALVSLATGYIPSTVEINLDWRVVGFTLALSLLTGMVFGLAPALQISKTDVQEALKEGGNSGSSPRGNWLRSLLVVAEVASALVLLVGAGLLIKSFTRLQSIDPGFRSENVLTMKLALPDTKYNSQPAATAFYKQLLERVETLPGVESAGVINLLPVQQSGTNGEIEVEGQEPAQPGKSPLVEVRTASPDYFRALGIPLVAGRFFNAADEEKSAQVVIVNEKFARRLIPNQDPLGKRIKTDTGGPITIVGVVGDVKQSGLTAEVRPELFSPYTQAFWPGMNQNMSLVVRTSHDPASLTAAIRKEVLAVDPAQPVYGVQTMEAVLGRAVSYQRLNMQLLGIFAALALLLAVIGIYSVMSYLVTQHTREIGIRMALGAQPRDVLKLVLGQGMILTLVGIGLGLLGAFMLTRLMSSLLYGVTATDPLTYVVVSALLVFVALFACYVPARRAMKVDPMVALRYE